MDRWLLVSVVAGALALSGLIGCKDKVRRLSTAETLLAEQHELWHKARESLRSADPQWGLLRGLEAYMADETPRRMKKDYAPANKDEVIAKLDALYKLYEEKVISKLDTTGPKVVLRPGVEPGDVRDAFEEVNKQYEEFEAITSGK